MEPMTILFVISLTLTIIGSIGFYIWRRGKTEEDQSSDQPGVYNIAQNEPHVEDQEEPLVKEMVNKEANEELSTNVQPRLVIGPLPSGATQQSEPLTTEDVQGMYDSYVTLWIDSKARNAALNRGPNKITEQALLKGKNDFLKLFDRGIDKGNAPDKSFSEAIHKALDGNHPLKNEKFNTARRAKIVQTVLKGQGQQSITPTSGQGQ